MGKLFYRLYLSSITSQVGANWYLLHAHYLRPTGCLAAGTSLFRTCQLNSVNHLWTYGTMMDNDSRQVVWGARFKPCIWDHSKAIQKLHETTHFLPFLLTVRGCIGKGPRDRENKAGPSGPSHHASTLAAARCRMSESNEAHFCRGEYLSLIS